ncbi:alkylphosphocholine resistance protein lem3 [Exophiala xenobiotica]|nr:alkylphosphocholine resistance protein lem3 [Exophiala xenobiotica]
MSQTNVVHTDSIHEEDPHNEPPKKQKNRRPANTAFRQQRLKAWQPILTPKTVLPIFFAIGIIFAPIGGLLLWASASVQELVIDYTNCNSSATTDFTAIPESKVSTSFKSSNTVARPQWRRTLNTTHPPYSVEIPNTPVCTLQFSIPNDIGPPVYLYYRLTNFYQNHRRYVKSLDTDQLKGTAISNDTIGGSSCNPLQLDHNGKAYYPCGLIANSIFNDTLNSPVAVSTSGGQESQQYRMTNEGIAWSTDASQYGKTKYRNSEVSPPPNWHRRYPNGYTDENPIPDLSQYEEFQVWMRTAGLPTFSKLALRNDNETMTAGTYQMDIYDFFPVTIYSGTKSILLSTRSVVGGKNNFLGIAYVVVGGLCIVLGVVFTIAHLIKPRKLGDHTYLSWNNIDAPSTAIASGRDTRPAAIAGLPRYEPITRSCGAPDPSANLTNTHRWLSQAEPLENDLWNATTVQERYIPLASSYHHDRVKKRQALSPLYTIDTYIHIIADSSTSNPSSANYITDTIIRNQFNYLAAAYTNASIGFRLAGVDRVTNDSWAANGDDLSMKRALRRGTYASLNIYYQSQLQANANTPGVPPGSTLLGFCTLPESGITPGMDRDEYVIDGCNVLSGTMPGGYYGGYNLGGTTAHEVGHWNGLLHTFTGNSCDVDDFGDCEFGCPFAVTAGGKREKYLGVSVLTCCDA